MISTPLSSSSAEVKKYEFPRRSLLPTRPNFLWKIESGIVRTVTWFEDGTLVPLGLWGQGDVVGTSLSKMNPYQMESLSQVEATLLPVDTWYQHTHALIEHIRVAEEFFIIRSTKRIDTALLMLLSWLGKKFGRTGEHCQQGQVIDLRLTHQDIAEILGSSRVTITRTLNKFEQQGFIQRLPKQLIVLQEEALWHYEI